MYLCHCDLQIVLIFNTIEKINTKKNITKIFIVLNVILRVVIQISCTNYKYLAHII